MARVPDEVPDFFPKGVHEPPLDELSDPDPLCDPEGSWDPVGLTLLGRWFTRAYLRAQADLAPDE